MKKVILALLVILGTSDLAHAQLRKGHRIFEAYYGFPNFGVLTGNLAKKGIKPIVEKNVPKLDQQVGVNISGMNPMGGRYEHLLSDRWSFTFTFVYNSTTVGFAVDSFRVEDVYVDNFEVNYQMQRFRGLFGFNYHFCNRPMWDAYFGLSGGFNSRTHKLSTDVLDIPGLSTSFSLAYPYAARTHIGFRFYPVQWLGAGMEFGLGGPLVSFGLSCRLNPGRK